MEPFQVGTLHLGRTNGGVEENYDRGCGCGAIERRLTRFRRRTRKCHMMWHRDHSGDRDLPKPDANKLD